ncbi:unnamed protein product [Prorocentrum cordatum]|uniref:Uncharacterized protein n=1 Tax=Prorocentrum cordatum TaxID=2364126 RepID=A0ABN9XPZ1_9DINO|nr:unnamed protein product [Polarella glacialis]
MLVNPALSLRMIRICVACPSILRLRGISATGHGYFKTQYGIARCPYLQEPPCMHSLVVLVLGMSDNSPSPSSAAGSFRFRGEAAGGSGFQFRRPFARPPDVLQVFGAKLLGV